MSYEIDPAATLWANIQSLMKKHYGDENITKFAKDCGIGVATVTRIKQQKTSIGLDILWKISIKHNLSPWQLLVPGFDPKNPPTLQPVTLAERRLYEKIMSTAKEVAQEMRSSYIEDPHHNPNGG